METPHLGMLIPVPLVKHQDDSQTPEYNARQFNKRKNYKGIDVQRSTAQRI